MSWKGKVCKEHLKHIIVTTYTFFKLHQIWRRRNIYPNTREYCVKEVGQLILCRTMAKQELGAQPRLVVLTQISVDLHFHLFIFFKASFSAVIYQSTAYGVSSKDSRQPVSLMPSASISLILLLLLQIKL